MVDCRIDRKNRIRVLFAANIFRCKLHGKRCCVYVLGEIDLNVYFVLVCNRQSIPLRQFA